MADNMEDAVMTDEPVIPTISVEDQAVLDIQSNFVLIRNAVAQFDPRLTLRALRSISTLRKVLTPTILARAMLLPTSDPSKQQKVVPLGSSHNVYQTIMSHSSIAASPATKELAEVQAYIAILIQVYLYDSKQYHDGSQYSDILVATIDSKNARTLDPLGAKAYFYYYLFHEQLAPLPPSSRANVLSIRAHLMSAHRSATLRKDYETKAMVIVLLLRNYLATAHISQADAFLRYIDFPTSASNNLYARFMYYHGRVLAIQLAYTEAHELLTKATRKAPTTPAAVGFYQSSMKFLILVELLTGDIPDRSYFSQPKLERSLEPYFELVKAVRAGEMQSFQRVVLQNAATFHKDGTHTLVLRLRQNVIRTGIRMISLSYSRISLGDICRRLELDIEKDPEQSTEYIVAKAIGDNVIKATINREAGYMQTIQSGDVYATREPADAFDEQIRSCLNIHDENVRAMRFPMDQHRLELKNAQEARERERELVTEIQDGDIDDDEDGGDFDGL